MEHQVTKLSKNMNKKPFVILINVEIIQQSIVNSFDKEKHILIQQKDQSIFVVIKNKQKLVKMFNELESLMRKYCEDQLLVVAYTSKCADTVYERLAKVNKQVADSMYYFDVSPHKYPTVRPNRAFISINNQKSFRTITYGQGYSQIKPKQQLRLAVQCAIGIYEQNERFLIIQTQKGIKQQQKDLRKQGYKHIWTVDNFDNKESLQSCLCQNRIFQQQQQSHSQLLLNKMEEEQTVLNSYYLNTLRLKLKQPEFNDIVSNIKLPHSECQLSPVIHIHDFLSKHKKSFTPVPKSSIRSPKSRQICSLVFKNVSDYKLYVAKSSLPKDIGGLYYEEKIENKCFMAIVGDVFAQQQQIWKNKKSGFYSLPMDKAYFMMKYTLLKPYETKKACMLIKPYLQDLVCLEEYAQQFVQLLSMQDNLIKGFGQLMFWSLVSGESFKTKTLLEQLSLVGATRLKVDQNQMNRKMIYITRGFDSIKSFMQQTQVDSLSLLRVDYFQPFSSSSDFNDFFSQKETNIKIPLTRNYSINLDQLNTHYLRQIYQLAILIACQGKNSGLKLIKGLAAHYKWEFDKSEIVDSFFVRAKKLLLYVQHMLESRDGDRKEKVFDVSYQEINSIFLAQLSQANPIALLLFMPQDYGRFIKPPQQDEQYFGEFFSKISLQKENQYVTTLIQKTHSFQIYGNSPPIYSLPNWVRSLGVKYRFIEYISMLNSTKEDFILISKRLKIMATNEKNSALLIVDHAQLCEDIIDEAKNIRTVFISRFKKGEHEIQVIYQQQNQSKDSKYLQDSNDQLITMLIEIYQRYIVKSDQKSYLFKRYQFVLENYIKIKCQQYGFSYNKTREFCLELHKNIAQSKNRFKQIQQRYKQNGQWKLLYALPVEKKNQKITFIKNLHSFIDVLKFVQLLSEKKQRGTESMIMESKQVKGIVKINPKLLSSLREWQRYIETEIKNNIIDQLIYYVTPLTSISIKQYLQTQREVDEFQLILQVLQVILSPYKNMQSKSSSSNEENRFCGRWNEIYYSLFPQQMGIYHYYGQSIINLTKISQDNVKLMQQRVSYIIQTYEKLSIFNFNATQQKFEKQCEINGELELITSIEEGKIINDDEPDKMYQEQNEQKSMIRLVCKQKNSNQLRILDIKTMEENVKLKQRMRQLELTVRLESQKSLIVRCLTRENQSSIEFSIKDFVFDEQILDFQLINSFQRENNYRQNDYILIVITTYHFLIYKIKLTVDENNHITMTRSTKQHPYNLQQQAQNVFSFNGNSYKQDKSLSMYEFLSVVNYNRLEKKKNKGKINQLKEISKSFICTIDKIFIQGNTLYEVNLHKGNGLKHLIPKNKNTPIIQILKPVKPTHQQLPTCAIIVLLVSKVNLEKQSSPQNNLFLAFINLTYQSTQISLIPIFNSQCKSELSCNKQFKVIHEVGIKQKQINSEKYLQLIIYYSLENYETKVNHFTCGLIHYPEVVNTVSLMIPYQHLFSQQALMNGSIIYARPKTHIFQNLRSSQKDELFIMSLQQTLGKESYMLTIQGTLGSTETEKSDSCIRLWKLNNKC